MNNKENMMKVYLATPIGDLDSEFRKNAVKAKEILLKSFDDIYCPWEMKIPHAWDYPNDEWGLMVFAKDVSELDECDLVVALSYGRESTAGSNWECGYAFGVGKKVLVVEMTDNIMSLMVSNGCYARVSGLNDLEEYNFSEMPAMKTDTEQK